MRTFRLPRWPILILLAAFFIGPTAGPVRAAPLPVPMSAATSAPDAAVQQVYYGWGRHYGRGRHHWRGPPPRGCRGVAARPRHSGGRQHYGYRRHYGYGRPYGYGYRRHWHHYRRPIYFY